MMTGPVYINGILAKKHWNDRRIQTQSTSSVVCTLTRDCNKRQLSIHKEVGYGTTKDADADQMKVDIEQAPFPWRLFVVTSGGDFTFANLIHGAHY